MFCLRVLIIQPVFGNSLHFVSAPSHDIRHILPPLLAPFVDACYSSQTQVCVEEAVQGFRIDSCCGWQHFYYYFVQYHRPGIEVGPG